MADFAPSPQQTQIFSFVGDPRRKHGVVEAGPGAGKSTTLVHACELMKGLIALGAYNTGMAKELREKTSHLPNVWAKTFHSFGMYALNQAFRGAPVRLREPDGKKVANIIERFIQENGRNDLTPIAGIVDDIVGMAKQRGIGVCFPDTHEEWMSMVDHFDLMIELPEGWDEEDKIRQIINMSRAMLRLSNDAARNFGLIDFNDMVFLPLLWNLNIKKFSWVLIDEAQDTNPTRRELAKRMLDTNGRLIAVGDPHQAIYGFSGADNDALDQIRREFNAITMPLTVSYRCPKAVVNVALRYYNSIEAHHTAPEGEYREIQYDKVADELTPGDAVLCRYNKFLVALCFKLIRMGKPAKIEGRKIGDGLIALAKKWRSPDLDALSDRITVWQEKEVRKAQEKNQERRVDEIIDRAETMFVLITRAQEQGINTVNGLTNIISTMFEDRVSEKRGIITLCSVHRSKGLEWHRVYVLGLDELMGKEQMQPWQTVQEVNLQWVASTRAKSILINVLGVKEEPKQHNFDNDLPELMTRDQARDMLSDMLGNF